MADPGVPIPEAASNVHGVTTEQAQAEGQPAAEVVAAALQLLRAVPTSVPIVGFNARFDLTILDREARRHGLEPFVPAPVLDGLVLDKHLDPYRKGSRRLEAVCEHYRCRLEARTTRRTTRSPRRAWPTASGRRRSSAMTALRACTSCRSTGRPSRRARCATTSASRGRRGRRERARGVARCPCALRSSISTRADASAAGTRWPAAAMRGMGATTHPRAGAQGPRLRAEVVARAGALHPALPPMP
jgi:hypothetical protein